MASLRSERVGPSQRKGQDLQAVLDFGSDGIEEGRLLAEEEELAEELRQAYVALTRARHRC